MDNNQIVIKNSNTHLSTQQQISTTIGSLSSRSYKCIRCETLAPNRWIIERHIRAKHPSDIDNMSDVIIEIDKSSTNGEPMTATKSSSSSSLLSSSDKDTTNSTVPKAFSCSACSVQSYNLWVILRHIRNVHNNDGSNAKIIDNINNQVNCFCLLFSILLINFLNRLLKIMMILNLMHLQIQIFHRIKQQQQ